MSETNTFEELIVIKCGDGTIYRQRPLVRCKDCKYCVKESNGELYCDILAVGYEPLGSKKVNSDWFCADGKRKDT